MNRFILLLAICLCGGCIYGQAPTKEQLLKLFFQAHKALNESNQTEAIQIYKQILKVSPGLPDPYLQLGDIYASMTTNKEALEKGMYVLCELFTLTSRSNECRGTENNYF